MNERIGRGFRRLTSCCGSRNLRADGRGRGSADHRIGAGMPGLASVPRAGDPAAGTDSDH